MDGLNFELGAPLSQTRRIVRHPLLKRNKPDEPLNERVRLERVLGVTVGSNASVDCSSEAGLLAYPAGGTVVLLRRGRQSHLAAPTSRKAITALRFSCDGQYLVTGESGHQPAVRVWDVQRRQLLHHFCAHKHGVTCVGFSPGNKYVVSVGFQHDMIVNVWDWQRNQKVASNKVSARVKAVSFADNGSYFVTVGNRHVKFWYLELARPSKLKEAVPLTGRSAILGEQRNNYFCDVACGRGETADSTFAITRSGLLCEFNNRRLLDKWVELRTETAYCMTASEQFIFIGCSDGLVRCFSPHTLRFITTLPRPHYLGVDVAQGLNISHMVNCPAGSRFPDCVGVCFDTVTRKLSCFYDDHSIYIWDVGDIRKVGKFASYLYHSACIWGVEMYPHHPTDASGGGGGGGGANTGSSVAPLPSGSFLTCSSDDTVRVWNLEAQLGASSSNLNRNVYSSELLKVLYMDSSLQHLKGNPTTPSAVVGVAGVAGTAAGGGSADKQDTAGYNCRNGVRSICVSPDGRSLASGDRRGNIRVHDLQLMEEQCMIEAHDGEVLCLQYSRPDTGLTLLASASRDRLIHLFNVAQQFEFVQTLDDHSSSITAVRFYQHQGRTCMVSCGADRSVIFREAVTSQSDTGRSQLQLHAPPPAATAAAAADSAADDSQVQFVLSRHVVGKTSLYDIEVDHSQRHILTACQDRNVRVYSVANGKQSRAFRGSSGDDGTLIKLALDQSGIYVVTSSTDKTLSIYDYFSGELMAVMHGHSELVTGVKFSPDCRHLVSVSGDGCVFVWRVPRDMQQTMAARLQQQWRRGRRRQTQSVAPIVPLTGVAPATDAEAGPDGDQRLSASRLPAPTFSPDPSADPGYDSTATNDRDLTDSYFRFSVGQLPRWARKDATVLVPSQLSPPEDTRAVPEPPRGRWGRRAADTAAAGGGADKAIFQHDHTDSLHPFPGYGTDSLRASSIPDSEASKDSSLEEARKTSPKPSAASLAGETAVANSRNGRNQNDDSSDLGSYRPDEGTTDHDGDIDSGPDSTENDTSEAAAVYFPQPLSDELSSSQYTVNAMDQDELRRSVRRYRRGRPSRLQLPQSSSSAAVITSAAASPVPDLESDLDFDLDEDDEDDDEEAVSTPSAEDGTAKRLGGLLSTSMESLSVATRQERYMVHNFSLTDSVRPERPRDSVSLGVKASISSQYHERSSDTVGTASTGATTGATITDRSEQSQRRRSELQRRIQETRQQLHNIGLRGVGGMRGSQSVCDLSRVAESAGGGGGGRLRRRRDSFHQQLQLSSARVRIESGDSQSGRYTITGPSGDMSDGGLAGGGGGGGPGGRLRRVVSLSDLTGATTGSQRVSTALAAGQPVSGRKTSAKKTRTASSMSRSTSLSSFDQGEAEGGRGSVRGGGVSTLCRPTISSANKHRSSSVSAAAVSTATRHRSTSAITTDACDSSSDCCASPELRKSVPPPGSGQQRLAHRNSGCHTVTVTATDKPLATSDLPVDQLPLSESECSAVSSLLQLAVDRFVQFHRRLAAASTPLPSTTVTASSSRNHHQQQQQQQQQLVALQLCQQLEHVATSASRTLSQVAATGSSSGAAGGATGAAAGGGGAVPNGTTDPALLHVMQQYSDALLSMVQQRIQQQQ